MPHSDSPRRLGRLTRHLRSNLVAYIALVVALTMTPLPSYAAKALVGTNQIKDGAVTTAKLHGSAVTGKKIKNGTIKKADLAVGARGFKTIVTKRVVVDGINANAISTRNVTCDAGQVAIGGGGYAVPTGIVLIGSTAGITERSHPSSPGGEPFFFNFPSGDGEAPQSWRTTVRNSEPDPTSVVHYAMCASK